MAVETAGPARGSTSLLTDQKFRSIVFQILVAAALVAFFAYIADNTITNLEKRGIASGFGFLFQPAGYDLAMTLIPYGPTDPHGRVLIIGIMNTLLVSVTGVILATIFGFIVGVLRLSPNWILGRLAYFYIEGLRNVPLLLQIIFWWSVFIFILPGPRDAIGVAPGVFLSNRGVTIPAPELQPGFNIVIASVVVAILAIVVLNRWAKKRQLATGQIFPVLPVSILILIVLPGLTSLIMGRPVTFDMPALKGFNFAGGTSLAPEFFALLFALSIYTSAFVAEIVRSGIMAISHGQTEAAYALGIKPRWTMRLIIIPQALRVIVPPLTSQYLNLTKNSSLAVAVGYPDLVATFAGTTLNQTGQAIECIAITMAVYLTLSLSTSAFMNWYNQRIALVER